MEIVRSVASFHALRPGNQPGEQFRLVAALAIAHLKMLFERLQQLDPSVPQLVPGKTHQGSSKKWHRT